ncbi:POM121-like protein 12 [Acomys russatus]|uniref:POM121-like protein 12 n=1 Tax=Acomys russatus TaxID=60746 RepID=UPI0021E20C57|nr:POM121-like protein 12 [Acomys russatus]
MGSSLSSPQRSTPAPAPRHLKSKPWPAWVQQGPGPKAPAQQNIHTPHRVVGTWRRSSIRPPTEATLGLGLSSAWDTYMKRGLWSVRNPRCTCSPVTVKIVHRAGRDSPLTTLQQGVARPVEHSMELPDPCAKETVLRALSKCKKGTRRFDGPLWFEAPEVKNRRQKPEPKPSSAFKPWIKNGVAVSFVPKPGPLNQSLDLYKKETDLQPCIHAAMGAVPEPCLESCEETQAACDPCLLSVQKTGAFRVSLAGGDFRSTTSFDF